MAEQKDDHQENPDRQKAMGAAAAAIPTMTDAQKMKSQSGGPQEDQAAGETDKGAHNQANRNRNPAGGHAGHGGAGRRGGKL